MKVVSCGAKKKGREKKGVKLIKCAILLFHRHEIGLYCTSYTYYVDDIASYRKKRWSR